MGLLDLIFGRNAPRDEVRPVQAISGAGAPRADDADAAEVAAARRLFTALAQYGIDNDENSVDALRSLYVESIPLIGEQERMRLLLAVIELAEARKISVNPLNAFLFVEPSQRIISTAALHIAPIHPATTEQDPLAGVRDLLVHAQGLAEASNEVAAVAILSGLLLLGDRRVVEAMRNCWRMLSPSGRAELLQMNGVRLYAPVIDWAIDWLEDCERDEFGAVAAALARWSQMAKAEGVVETRRALPLWSRPANEAVTLVAEWTFAEFGKRIRSRLEAIAEREAEPRVMPDVLATWELGGLSDLPPALRGRTAHRSDKLAPRDLLALLPPDSLLRSQPIRSIAVNEEEILRLGGQWLVLWGIFNPYGPTLSSLSLLHTADEEIDLLLYRMLNPFRQDSVVVATVVGSPEQKHAAARRYAEGAFRSNILSAPDGETLELVTCLQSFVFSVWDENASDDLLPTVFVSSPGILGDHDMPRWFEDISEYPADPWGRAGKYRDALFRAWIAIQKGETLPDPEVVELPLAERLELARKWWEHVRSPKHWIIEMMQIPVAWSGAISEYRRNNPEASLGEPYTFDRVEAFLERHGFVLFRVLHEQAQLLTQGDTDRS